MNISSQILFNDIDSDEEMIMNSNIYIDFQGITKSQKNKMREVIDRHYREMLSEVKSIT